jgi:hypothetical protein
LKTTPKRGHGDVVCTVEDIQTSNIKTPTKEPFSQGRQLRAPGVARTTDLQKKLKSNLKEKSKSMWQQRATLPGWATNLLPRHQPPLGLEQTTKLERQVQLHVWGLVGPEWATLGLEQTSELERQLQLQLWGLVGRRQPEWWRKVATNLPPWRQPLGLEQSTELGRQLHLFP